jgi:hypothetical protein
MDSWQLETEQALERMWEDAVTEIDSINPRECQQAAAQRQKCVVHNFFEQNLSMKRIGTCQRLCMKCSRL